MKLYWSPRSPFVRKVMVCAHELGIADRLQKIYTLVSVTGVNSDMLRVNPLGRIPALVPDEGGVLYDSIVICEFLDAGDGRHRLFPADGKARWDALRRHALADGLLEMLVLWRSLRNPGAGAPSPTVLDAFRTKVQSALAAAESEAPGAIRFDIGDVTLGVVLGYLDFRYPEMNWRREHTQLADWFGAVASRPSMQQSAPEDELERTRST